jgi:hypothetical protein
MFVYLFVFLLIETDSLIYLMYLNPCCCVLSFYRLPWTAFHELFSMNFICVLFLSGFFVCACCLRCCHYLFIFFFCSLCKRTTSVNVTKCYCILDVRSYHIALASHLHRTCIALASHLHRTCIACQSSCHCIHRCNVPSALNSTGSICGLVFWLKYK